MSSKAIRKRPLSPMTFLLRNTQKTAPLTLVIVLSVMLIGGIVAMMNSIPLSIKVIYSYSRHYLGVTPRGDASLTPSIRRRIEEKSPVEIDRILVCRASSAQVKSLVGKWPFVVLALNEPDMRYYLGRMGGGKVVGRLPLGTAPEAVISEPVARNLNLKLGDALLGPEKEGDFSPKRVKVVGIVHTQEWIMLCPIEYHKLHHWPKTDLLLVFAQNLQEQGRLDRWAENEFKGERTQLFAYHQLEKDTDEMFSMLYRILNVVIGMLVLVITFMMALLMNIYQTQRMQEFGLLQALGYTKRKLLRRTIVESLIVLAGGWTLGLVLAVVMLNIVYDVLMHPNAFALDPTDPVAFRYTIPVPIAILLAASLTVSLKFRSFDPIRIVERRLG